MVHFIVQYIYIYAYMNIVLNIYVHYIYTVYTHIYIYTYIYILSFIIIYYTYIYVCVYGCVVPGDFIPWTMVSGVFDRFWGRDYIILYNLHIYIEIWRYHYNTYIYICIIFFNFIPLYGNSQIIYLYIHFYIIYRYTQDQCEFQDAKIEELSHIKPYLGGISP